MHALASFALGGRLVVMLPKSSAAIATTSTPPEETEFGFGAAAAVPESAGAVVAGPISIYALRELLATDDHVRGITNGFIGPLDLASGPAKGEVLLYIERTAAQMELYEQFRTLALLWRLLAIAVRHNGRLGPAHAGVSSQPENMVRYFLAQHPMIYYRAQDEVTREIAQLLAHVEPARARVAIGACHGCH